MPESNNQQLFDKIINLIIAIEIFYEQVIETENLPNVKDRFLEWYGIVLDFMREQRVVGVYFNFFRNGILLFLCVCCWTYD